MYGDLLDEDFLLRSVLFVYFDSFDLGQRSSALIPQKLAKDGVQPVQMRRLVKGDEELRPIRAGPLVGHGHGAAGVVFQRGPDLVLKGAAPDGLPALWVLRRRVAGAARLHHEVGDQPVKGRLIIVSGGTEGQEVLLGVLAFRSHRWKGLFVRCQACVLYLC